MPETRLGIVLTPLKAKIYDAIWLRGREGVIGSELLRDVNIWRDNCGDAQLSYKTLKSHIWQINSMLEGSGKYIRGIHGRHRIDYYYAVVSGSPTRKRVT